MTNFRLTPDGDSQAKLLTAAIKDPTRQALSNLAQSAAQRDRQIEDAISGAGGGGAAAQHGTVTAYNALTLSTTVTVAAGSVTAANETGFALAVGYLVTIVTDSLGANYVVGLNQTGVGTPPPSWATPLMSVDMPLDTSVLSPPGRANFANAQSNGTFPMFTGWTRDLDGVLPTPAGVGVVYNTQNAAGSGSGLAKAALGVSAPTAYPALTPAKSVHQRSGNLYAFGTSGEAAYKWTAPATWTNLGAFNAVPNCPAEHGGYFYGFSSTSSKALARIDIATGVRTVGTAGAALQQAHSAPVITPSGQVVCVSGINISSTASTKLYVNPTVAGAWGGTGWTTPGNMQVWDILGYPSGIQNVGNLNVFMAGDPFGNVWISGYYNSITRLTKFNPTTGTYTQFASYGNLGSGPIAALADGTILIGVRVVGSGTLWPKLYRTDGTFTSVVWEHPSGPVAYTVAASQGVEPMPQVAPGSMVARWSSFTAGQTSTATGGTTLYEATFS